MKDNKQIVRQALEIIACEVTNKELSTYLEVQSSRKFAKHALKALDNLTDTVALSENLQGLKIGFSFHLSDEFINGVNYGIDKAIELVNRDRRSDR